MTLTQYTDDDIDCDYLEFLGSPTTIEHVLASIPPDYVEKVLTATKKRSARERILPSRLMIHFPILLGLNMELPYGEVFRRLEGAYEWLGIEVPEEFPSESAMVQARHRLGFEPLKELFEQVVLDRSQPEAAEAYFRGLLLTAVDGCVFDVEDSKENAIFGFPQNQAGAGAYPQVSCVAVVNFYTRTLEDVEIGTVAGTGEYTIAMGLLSRLKAGTLNLADRLYPSYNTWTLAHSTGAHLLWRVQKGFRLDPIKHFKDGSYLAKIYHRDEKTKKRIVDESVIVRVIEYTLLESKEIYRLITTLLDPEQAPATELAQLYPLRYWTSEGFNKEIKTILRTPRIVLRSKKPEMVIQELYGMFLAHDMVRLLISQAAQNHNRAPAEISFKNAVHVIRRRLTQAGSFSPGAVCSYSTY